MTASVQHAPTTPEEVMAILNGAPTRVVQDINKQLTEGDPVDRDQAIGFLERLFQLRLNLTGSPFFDKLSYGSHYDQRGHLTPAGLKIVNSTMPYMDISEVNQLTYSTTHDYLKLPLPEVARYIAWVFKCQKDGK